MPARQRLAIGMITPPFGVNLFAVRQVANSPFEQIPKPLESFALVAIS
jgi:TRAP-type C4-dicarboxylate transport system permease large subunit